MSNLTVALMSLFSQRKPASVNLARGLTLVYRPPDVFAVGRKGVAPGDVEIRAVIRAARGAGVLLHDSPTRRTLAGPDATWHVAEWRLERIKL